MKKYLSILTIMLVLFACKKNECANDTLVGKAYSVTETGTSVPLLEANVFTPNNDGKNDNFSGPVITGSFLDSVVSDTLRIYCGSSLLATVTSYPGWNGSGQGEGVYRYEETYNMVNGGYATASGYVHLSKGETVSCQEKALFKFPEAYDAGGFYSTSSVYNENISCH